MIVKLQLKMDNPPDAAHGELKIGNGILRILGRSYAHTEFCETCNTVTQ